MIEYREGNLLDDSAEALVNTVNEVGVMGKGIALMFREGFPLNTERYEAACRQGEVRVGKMLVTPTKELVGPKWIINFPTKKHWRHPSQIEWIRDGLVDLVRVVKEHNIRSIAIPPLGCGNGGLQWTQVQPAIEAALRELPDVVMHVYVPTSTYQNARKGRGVSELTPARALIIELIRRYTVLGIDCTNLEVQKLAWFLWRSMERLKLPDILRLQFTANRYGPYADQLRHLLDGLDGSFLHCEKRLADAGPLDLIWFEEDRRADVERYLTSDAASDYIPALDQASHVIDGFESPYGMELLATVDWLLQVEKREPNIESIRLGISAWPHSAAAGRRKQKLFDDRSLASAIHRIAPLEAVQP